MSNSIEPSNDNIQETNGTEIVENTGDNDERSLSSNLYKDFSGIDTESFIMTTLKNNPKDRTLLLSLEKVFQEFIQNEEQTSHQFQAMNSYERMIVHRVAAFFGLDHNVDKNGQSIIVTKTANTRIPNLCFQTIIPTDETTNGANNNSNESNSRRSTTIRTTNKTSNQQIFQLNKTSTVDRSNYYLDNREKYLNKFHRKQQRFHAQQPTSQFSNSGNQPMYSSISTPYYPQQSIEHDYKQQTTNSPMHNYVQMIGPNTYQHGTNLPVPILLHQQPTGQIQYVFPAQQQQQQQQLPIPSDGQYMPIYHSDGIAHVMDNNLYSPSPYVQVYPTHPYHPTQQSAPSFLIPSTNPSNAIQYATNQLAALNLQSQYDSDTRFIPSMHSNKSFQSTRHIRPMNFHSTDKQQLTSNENEIKSSDQTIRQEKD